MSHPALIPSRHRDSPRTHSDSGRCPREETWDTELRPAPLDWRTDHSPLDNGILRRLEDDERYALLLDVMPYHARSGDGIFEADERRSAMTFPLSGMISLVVMTSDGATVEVNTVGRDGVAGIHLHLVGRPQPAASGGGTDRSLAAAGRRRSPNGGYGVDP